MNNSFNSLSAPQRIRARQMILRSAQKIDIFKTEPELEINWKGTQQQKRTQEWNCVGFKILLFK